VDGAGGRWDLDAEGGGARRQEARDARGAAGRGGSAFYQGEGQVFDG
jgi:hypothetical protein